MYTVDKWDVDYLSEKEGEAAMFGGTARQGLDDAIQHTKQLLDQVPLYETFVRRAILSSSLLTFHTAASICRKMQTLVVSSMHLNWWNDAQLVNLWQYRYNGPCIATQTKELAWQPRHAIA